MSEPPTELAVTVRPMVDADVAAANDVAYASLTRMMEVYADHPAEPRPPEQVPRGERRIRHLLATDPGGAWVAVEDGKPDGGAVVGVGLAIRRGGLWFLSLLAVATEAQGARVGRRLLDATLTHADGCDALEICSSPDPKALRRYQAAGFALHPAYYAEGPLDRALVPAGLGVRDGDLDRDRELCEAVGVALRGVGHGPDLDWMLETEGSRLLVGDDGDDLGVAVLRGGRLSLLGATGPGLACRLLWAAMAETTAEQVEVAWLTSTQQWAIDTVLAARLPLAPGPSICLRGSLGPLTPYLPSGIVG